MIFIGKDKDFRLIPNFYPYQSFFVRMGYDKNFYR